MLCVQRLWGKAVELFFTALWPGDAGLNPTPVPPAGSMLYSWGKVSSDPGLDAVCDLLMGLLHGEKVMQSSALKGIYTKYSCVVFGSKQPSTA